MTYKRGPGPTIVQPGTCGHRILTELANHNGIYNGGINSLAAVIDWDSERTASSTIARLRREGKTAAVRGKGREAIQTRLTAAGWHAIGLEPPEGWIDWAERQAERLEARHRDTFKPGRKPPVRVDGKSLLDGFSLPPIEKRKFDPQKIRDAQAALG